MKNNPAIVGIAYLPNQKMLPYNPCVVSMVIVKIIIAKKIALFLTKNSSK